MCFGGGPVGPQKYSGGSSSASTTGEDKHRDSDGNVFGSSEYHAKIRSDANERSLSSRESGTYGKTDKRTGSKSLISSIKSMF